MQILRKKFHVAMHLFSNWSQIIENAVSTKKWKVLVIAECHRFCYDLFTSSVIYYWKDAQQHGIYLSYNNQTKSQSSIHQSYNWSYVMTNPNTRIIWHVQYNTFYTPGRLTSTSNNNLNLLTIIYHTVLIQQYLTLYTIGFLCLIMQCTSTM